MAYADDFGLDPVIAKKIASTFGGGMGRLRKTCGALTGAFMVIGLKYGNIEPGPTDEKLAAYRRVRELANRFEEIHGSIECGTLLAKHGIQKDQIKLREHHNIICQKLVRDAALLLEKVI